ncbi:NUDIX domain-containing protein [Saccharopolyspora dendranthemae]|uniref:8-oxo-dGTP diphosphatase n=1 Tax=Saccharopolyspora dendranthemae TaxID=1181886 RepID=A0A561U8L0_9PSEU|nr:NUDIX domain-containing protein [Saccharopolyspora dendranthemae]TWF95685.1 8-oxo-dGTP diphosphatase [Saccharopolyspora dendranthemae]
MNSAQLAELVARDAADGVGQQVVRALILRSDRALMLRRPDHGFRGGVWEMPGGKVEPHDCDLLEALRREVREETGLDVTGVTRYLAAFDYTSRKGRSVRQHTWAVTVAGERVRLTEHDAYVWTNAHDTHPISPEDRDLINRHATPHLQG